VSRPCTVLIAAPDLLPLLKQRVGEAGTELISFGDGDVIRALEVITERKPQVVALERLFAATPRGAALINRLKADPALVDAEIRVVSHDSDYTRVSPRRPPAEPAEQRPARETPPPAAAAKPPQPLDQRGTRRAARFKVGKQAGVLVDGTAATIVDLSKVGAQVVTPAIVKPNQRVRLALTDDTGAIRFNAMVAWAKFEIPPKSSPQYRAGLNFLDANAAAVEAFCQRHKT
jgi:hypothetical protein